MSFMNSLSYIHVIETLCKHEDEILTKELNLIRSLAILFYAHDVVLTRKNKYE